MSSDAAVVAGTGPLTYGTLLAAARGMQGLHGGRIRRFALVFFLPGVVLAAELGELVEDHYETDPSTIEAGLVLLAVIARGIGLLGPVLFAGFLEAAVGSEYYGHGERTIPQVLRELHWGRLVLADFLLVGATLAASAVLILPGMVVYTFFCLVGPLVNMRGHGVLKAFAESVRLVRPRFFLVFFTVTLPVAIEVAAHHALETLLHDSGILVVIVANWLLIATVYTAIGLFEVALAFELVARDEADQPAKG